MEKRLNRVKISRQRRVFRVRKALKGTLTKPRLSVYKSNKHLYAQLIDDTNSHTLASACTLSKEKMKKSKESAKQIGLTIAKLAKEKNINNIVFDRGRFKYHGLIAHLADGAREGGLEF
jgi:large subunit ribosomal protein L18